ncbi:group II intron maturase-specific domain-containing protein [Thiohalomonas denitrificans]|uniref:group II intron maturase-specific domain-containing protein n=1 Tax=Thiohalomonas denitrificans TaxID=415747 RepID=UPI0026EAD96B
MAYRLYKLAQYVRGWMGYFGISEYYRPIPGLDQWLRRRIRMCYWKRWRKTRTKVRNQPAVTGDEQTPRDLHSPQQQELLASVEDAGDANGDDE